MILAIETSCDEVSLALVDSNFKVHKNLIFSSLEKAKKTGGVVPEIAAREASKMIIKVLNEIKNDLIWDKIKAIAVTNNPGLVGSLMVGIEAAKTLAMIFNKPLIPVFHIFGHMSSIFLDKPKSEIQFPILVLTASGGHNDLYIWKSPLDYECIGKTIDDASGECFDKCARMLDLGYPGGPVLSKKAEKGNSLAFDFPRPMKNQNILNFSFSGLKTSLLYKIKDLGGIKSISENIVSDLSASIEFAICDALLSKLFLAQKKTGIKNLAITGGVSANKLLRKMFLEKTEKLNLNAFLSKKLEYCTDNGAMIGSAAELIWQNTKEKEFDFEKISVF